MYWNQLYLGKLCREDRVALIRHVKELPQYDGGDDETVFLKYPCEEDGVLMLQLLHEKLNRLPGIRAELRKLKPYGHRV